MSEENKYYIHDYHVKDKELPSRFVRSQIAGLNQKKLSAHQPIINAANDLTREELLK
ncbi:hypothetical protein [Mycobacterium sp.]|uniref:hypothetical protein n=1 Tax=Mycobacterium sp. TaxID=1785 RepID=UPI003A88E43B